MKELTDKQAEFFNYYDGYISQHGRRPTYKEIRDRFGFKSDNSTTQIFTALKKKGYMDSDYTPIHDFCPYCKQYYREAA